MGPLFTRVGKQLRLAGFTGSSRQGDTDTTPSAKYGIGPHRIVDHGFQRMNDGNSSSALAGTMTPTIGKSVQDPRDAYDMDQVRKGGILVRMDVEQEYREPYRS